MKVYSWVGEHPNFGDDLNHFLWDFLMPEVVADPDDGALLVGVGTVLSAKLPAARPRVVMGSGVGYSAAPADVTGSDWRVYAVRGPLTAQLLGLPVDRGVADPAVMLPTMPDWTAASHGDAIFVPHWTTALDPMWQGASAAAGLRFVDPRGEARAVIGQIAGARLVVAESMHGAIIADAFRVPWVPVFGTHRSMFKWRDWASSLDMEYAPRSVGLSAHIQARLAPNPQYTGKDASPRSELSGGPNRPSAAQRVQSALRFIPAPIRQGLVARDLASAARATPCNSKDAALADRQRLLRQRIEQLREDYAAGRIVARATGTAA